jgi:two-component system sensor histidine kinase AlgZ
VSYLQASAVNAPTPTTRWIPADSVVRATWRGLLMPRRLLPILVVCVPMLIAQTTYSRDKHALILGVLLCISFLAVAPVSYRFLFPEGLDLTHGAARLVLYAMMGVGVVLSVGVAVPKIFGIGVTFLTARSSLLIDATLFLVGGWGLGRDIAYEQRVDRLTREAERAQLLALRSHLDPHFLFNTLNAIAEWCRQDGEVAERAVLELSAMLRAMLDGVRSNAWPLTKELEMVRNLFDLHRMRDKDRFTFEENLPADLPAVNVPPMSLLTLAENAMKHGPGAGHRGVVTLSVKREGAGTRLILENPGRYSGPRAGSQGLPTLERRLRLAYDGHARLSVGPAVDVERTCSELWIPDQEAQ